MLELLEVARKNDKILCHSNEVTFDFILPADQGFELYILKHVPWLYHWSLLFNQTKSGRDQRYFWKRNIFCWSPGKNVSFWSETIEKMKSNDFRMTKLVIWKSTQCVGLIRKIGIHSCHPRGKERCQGNRARLYYFSAIHPGETFECLFWNWRGSCENPWAKATWIT